MGPVAVVEAVEVLLARPVQGPTTVQVVITILVPALVQRITQA
jgi:hypothetical protein